VVFLSHCLLNQNTRYPGGAVWPGVVVDAVSPYLADGTGIVQMACPEQRTWGGVTKRHLLRLLAHPAGARAGRHLLPPVRRYLRTRYRRLARAVVAEVQDYTTSGLAPAIRRGRGLFTEALQAELSAQHHAVAVTEFALRRSDLPC
jgi:uncharacterized protein YbbK (DUF523 family)